MAKTSQVARQNKRERLVLKFIEKRKQLKDSADYEVDSDTTGSTLRLSSQIEEAGLARH